MISPRIPKSLTSVQSTCTKCDILRKTSSREILLPCLSATSLENLKTIDCENKGFLKNL